MCEPKLMIFDDQNYNVDNIGDHCRKPKTLSVPLIDPNCSNTKSPLSNFVNKCQALLKIRAQLRLKEKEAKNKKKAAVENKYSLQLLPDYHSSEFAPVTKETPGKNGKNKAKKRKIRTECNTQNFENHISPELQELIEPNNIPIGEPCPQPMSVTYRILDDLTENQNAPIVVNETYPELAKYIRQLMNANTVTNAMYGIDFNAPVFQDVPMEARPNPYEILIPTIIEGLLNKLISSSSLSQTETEMFANFIYVAKSLEPHDLKTYFHLLKMRGVALWNTVDKLRFRLLELKPHELITMKIEDFLRDLKSAVLFGDPNEIKKEQKRIKMEHASRLEDALRETEEWIIKTIGHTKNTVNKDNTMTTATKMHYIEPHKLDSQKAGILKVSESSKQPTSKLQSSDPLNPKRVPSTQTPQTLAERKDTSDKREDFKTKDSISKEKLSKKGIAKTYPDVATKESDSKKNQEKKAQEFDEVRGTGDDAFKISGKDKDKDKEKEKEIEKEREKEKEATAKQSKKDTSDNKENLHPQGLPDTQRRPSQEKQLITTKDVILLQKQSNKKDAPQMEKSEASIPLSSQEKSDQKVKKSAETKGSSQQQPTAVEDKKPSPQLIEMQGKTQLQLGDANRGAKAQQSEKKDTTLLSRDAPPQPTVTTTKQQQQQQGQQQPMAPQLQPTEIAKQQRPMAMSDLTDSKVTRQPRDLNIDGEIPTDQSKISSKKKEKDTGAREIPQDKVITLQPKIHIENLDDYFQANKISREAKEEKSMFPSDMDAISLRSLKPGFERDFRTKLASAFSAAQKYADKTLFVQDSYAPEELVKYQKHSTFEPSVEVYKPPLTKTPSKIFNDSLQLLERYSYTNTGARKSGYYEPWDVEWPWPDLQEYITSMQNRYIKSIPDQNFIFRRGMEYYQAEFRRYN